MKCTYLKSKTLPPALACLGETFYKKNIESTIVDRFLLKTTTSASLSSHHQWDKNPDLIFWQGTPTTNTHILEKEKSQVR